MTTPLHALLLTAPGCPHCPGIKASLQKLHQEGVIDELELIDITTQPDKAAELGVRSVPWLKLGEFILSGAQTPQALREWAERAKEPGGMRDYLSHLLANGELAEAQKALNAQPHHLPLLITLLSDAESPIQVKLGASAIIEGLEGSRTLERLIPKLIALSEHADHRLRSDACHFLGLTHDKSVRETLQRRLNDEHPEVREIAQEALDEL